VYLHDWTKYQVLGVPVNYSKKRRSGCRNNGQLLHGCGTTSSMNTGQLLYDTWHTGIYKNALILLESFHNKVAWYISHQHIQKINNTEINLEYMILSINANKPYWSQDRPIYQQACFIKNKADPCPVPVPVPSHDPAGKFPSCRYLYLYPSQKVSGSSLIDPPSREFF
jgi:hypothetical protein